MQNCGCLRRTKNVNRKVSSCTSIYIRKYGIKKKLFNLQNLLFYCWHLTGAYKVEYIRFLQSDQKSRRGSDIQFIPFRTYKFHTFHFSTKTTPLSPISHAKNFPNHQHLIFNKNISMDRISGFDIRIRTPDLAAVYPISKKTKKHPAKYHMNLGMFNQSG